jgi:hypothetical protein
MPMLYVLGAALVIALIVWLILPGLSVWSVLVLLALAFLVLWQGFIIATLLREFVSLFFGPRPPKPRMTNEQVMALAAEALAKHGINSPIGLVNVQRTDGRLTWIVMTLIRGAGSTVHIDDATGEVSVRHWGSR